MAFCAAYYRRMLGLSNGAGYVVSSGAWVTRSLQRAGWQVIPAADVRPQAVCKDSSRAELRAIPVGGDVAIPNIFRRGPNTQD
jgi:hypothetical protein